MALDIHRRSTTADAGDHDSGQNAVVSANEGRFGTSSHA
jgi:hypothetical protein